MRCVASGPHDRRGDGGRPFARRQAVHARRPGRDRQRAGRQVDRLHEAADTPPASPFFLYLPFSMGHTPIFRRRQFAGKSRIGNYGDKMMEGDYHVGQILDALKELGIDDDTIVVFASDNGPQGDDGARTRQQRHAGHGHSAARSAANSATRPKARSAPSPSSAGPATSSRTRPPTPCSRSWIFCRRLRAIIGGKMPDRPADRRGRPERRAVRQERDSAIATAPDLHRAGPGGGALEAVAHLLHRHPSDRRRAAAARRPRIGQQRPWPAIRRSSTSRWTRASS